MATQGHAGDVRHGGRREDARPPHTEAKTPDKEVSMIHTSLSHPLTLPRYGLGPAGIREGTLVDRPLAGLSQLGLSLT
jgi:hypothetical protein